jgi:hypothetical protein
LKRAYSDSRYSFDVEHAPGYKRTYSGLCKGDLEDIVDMLRRLRKMAAAEFRKKYPQQCAAVEEFHKKAAAAAETATAKLGDGEIAKLGDAENLGSLSADAPPSKMRKIEGESASSSSSSSSAATSSANSNNTDANGNNVKTTSPAADFPLDKKLQYVMQLRLLFKAMAAHVFRPSGAMLQAAQRSQWQEAIIRSLVPPPNSPALDIPDNSLQQHTSVQAFHEGELSDAHGTAASTIWTAEEQEILRSFMSIGEKSGGSGVCTIQTTGVGMEIRQGAKRMLVSFMESSYAADGSHAGLGVKEWPVGDVRMKWSDLQAAMVMHPVDDAHQLFAL